MSDAARLAGQTLLCFGVTALIAVSIGIGLGLLTEPGRNSSVDPAAQRAPETTGGWSNFLTGLVPADVLGLETSSDGLSFNVLQLLVLAVAVGVAALKVGEPAEPFLALTRSALAVGQELLWWVILLAPIGTVGLTGNAVASHGRESLGSLGVFAAAVYAGLALVLRGDLPGAGRGLRGPVLRRRPRADPLPADRAGVRGRLGRHRPAGVTGAVVMLTLTLSTPGLPLAGVGLLPAIDPILDMGRTAVNVAGQALVPTIVAKREGILDEELFRSTSAARPLAPVAERGGVDADLRPTTV